MGTVATRIPSYLPSGAVLSKHEIEASYTENRDEFVAFSSRTEGYRILLTNYDPTHVEPASYDLSVGDSAFYPKRIRSGSPFLDRDKEPDDFARLCREQKAVLLGRNDVLIVPPGESVIVRTNELVGIPNAITALVTTKVNHAFHGILQPTSRIDPGFVGYVYIPLFNLGRNDLQLKRSEKLCNLVFLKVTSVESGRGPRDPEAIRKSPHMGRAYNEPSSMTEDQLLAELPKHGLGFEYVVEYLKKISGLRSK